MNNLTIINKSDSKSKSRAIKQNIRAKLYKVENNKIFYTVTSGGGTKQYLVIIMLLDLTDNKLKSLKTALSGDIKISCNCYAFLYHGFKYIAFKNNVGIEPENRPPDKTNPNREGMACKHIIAALNQMKYDYNTIYNKFKELQLPDKKITPIDNKNSDTFTNVDLQAIESFKDACTNLYNQYNKYLSDRTIEDGVRFVDTKYYNGVNPSLILASLSKPCIKELNKLFISKLKTLDNIINTIDQKKNGFNILLKSDTDRLIKKINSAVHSENEAIINNIILSLLDYS